MQHLSALDAAFLYLETPQTPMNIGSLTIFAPTMLSPDAIFEHFRAHTVARLDVLPSYRRRLRPSPLGIDHPVWVTGETLDLQYHIRRRALPRPGSMDQLRAMVGELHAVRLDRTKPLWQYYLIEGLEGGGFAVYVKLHHAEMDGVAGMATIPVVFDATPTGGPVAVTVPARAAERPGIARMIGGALADFLAQDLRLMRGMPGLAAALTAVARRATGTWRLLPDALRFAPHTPFNVSISANRVFATASVPLSEVKRIGKARHATVNDVVLALCAGALSRYLSARKAMPRRPLIAAVPVSIREAGDSRLNNQVAAVPCSLATDMADPLRRLAAIADSSRDSRSRFGDIRPVWPSDFAMFGMPAVITGLARLAARTRVSDFVPGLANIWISNVPGPQRPIYCAGVPALHYFPISIPYHGFALEITAQSYLDNIEFGLTACAVTVPDAQAIADDLPAQLAALARAVDAIGDTGSVEVIEVARTLPEAAAPAVSPRRARLAV